MEKVDINLIKENKENPRYITDNKFKKLIKSIQDFPEMLEKRPIVVDENMIVLGGNMRLKACKEAGIKNVFISVAKGWSEEKKKEFIIKDNVGFGVWDWDLLANEWITSKLDEWGLDVPDYLEEPNEDDLFQDDKNEKPSMKITFENFEDLNDFEKDLKTLLEKYENAFYSVNGWNGN